MKRQLVEIDAVLPNSVEKLFPGEGFLSKVNILYEQAEDILLKKKRVDVAINAEPQIVQRILRVFIRHEFHGSPDNDKPHYLLHVEGLLLDGSSSGGFPLSAFFERITIQSQNEKKNTSSAQSLDWKEEDLRGITAHCFRAKVYADKASTVKIGLYRANDVCARYNISDQLRFLLPYLRVDPTEDEVLLAMWQYFEANGLIGMDRDRRYVKLTEVLKELFYGNRDYPSPSILISSLRTRLLPHLVLARPLVVEHALSPVNTPELFALSVKNNYSLSGGGRWPTSIAYARVGGRVFDLEVDVLDGACQDVLSAVNRCAAAEYAANDRIRTHLEKLAFLARRMQQVAQEEEQLRSALAVFDAVVATGETSGGETKAPIGIPSIESTTIAMDSAFFYERIRNRPPTERVEQPVHSYVPASASAGVSAGGSVANEGKDSREIKPEPGHTFTSHPVGATSAAAAAGGKGTSSFTGSKPPLQPKASLAAAATSATASGVRGEAVATRCTSLHTLTGYLDIGNDDLFGEDKEWVRPACERLVLPSQAKSVRSEKQ